MDFQSRREADCTVITIAGKLDAVTAPEYERKMQELINCGETRFVLDVARLDYISSAGLRGLLVTAKLLKAEKGELRLANVVGTVKEVFDISGFGSIFRRDDTVAAALAALS